MMMLRVYTVRMIKFRLLSFKTGYVDKTLINDSVPALHYYFRVGFAWLN